MARKSVDTEAILRKLEEMYPDAKCALNHRNAFELLVATVLSAQCTDARVNIVTARIFPRYNRPEHFAGAVGGRDRRDDPRLRAVEEQGEEDIQGLSQMLLEKHGGEVPSTMEELIQLPGVGRKTANVVLSNAFGIPAIAVDTHVFRVANRLGLAEAKTPEETERQLMERIPREYWSQAHHWLIYHGRQVCHARNPQCSQCPLLPHCRFGRQAGKGSVQRARVSSGRAARRAGGTGAVTPAAAAETAGIQHSPPQEDRRCRSGSPSPEYRRSGARRGNAPFMRLQEATTHVTNTRQLFSTDRLRLEVGETISATVGYETYGRLNARRDNAVLLCHPLAADCHAAAGPADPDRAGGSR